MPITDTIKVYCMDNNTNKISEIVWNKMLYKYGCHFNIALRGIMWSEFTKAVSFKTD